MTPPAVFVLVAGVLLVLAVAAVALRLDARRRAAPPRRSSRRAPWPRGSTPPAGAMPPGRSSRPGPAQPDPSIRPGRSTHPSRSTRSGGSAPQAGAGPSTDADPQTDPIVTAVAREDPPTIAAPRPLVVRLPDEPPPRPPRPGGLGVSASVPDQVEDRSRALPAPVVHPRPHRNDR